jgi:uncharacterized membrane protein (Fun14 family)
MTDLSTLLPVLTEAGGTGLLGFLLGYGVKKLLKLLIAIGAVLLAVILAPFIYLASIGIIQIDWSRLTAMLTSMGDSALSGAVTTVTTFTAFLSLVPWVAGFALGFAYGLKRG